MKKITCPFFLATFLFFLFPLKASAQSINEFVVDANPEWVEIYNSSKSADYLKSYWIDDDTDFNDDTGNRAKKQLASLNIGSVTFPYFNLPVSVFMFNNDGDMVVLFDASGKIVDQHPYSSNPGKDITIGRNPDGSGGFSVLESATKGAANSSPASIPESTPESTEEPTSDPTDEPTSDPTSTPTSTPKSTVKARATRRPVSEKDDEDHEGVVIGLRDELSTPEATEEAEGNGKVPWGSILLIIVGLGFIGLAGYAFYTQKEKGQVDEKPGEKVE